MHYVWCFLDYEKSWTMKISVDLPNFMLTDSGRLCDSQCNMRISKEEPQELSCASTSAIQPPDDFE